MREKINNKKARIAVIGLGYVGLPLAALIAQKGFQVTGFVRDPSKIHQKGIQVAHIDSDELSEHDVFIICVPTPVFHTKKPDLEAIRSVAKRLSLLQLAGKLIINESTVAPGTTREEFGSLGGEYFLACSPERVDPGNKNKTVRTISKIVGGINKESQVLAKMFYEKILDAPVVSVSSLEAAEMVKMLENTYRAVNIALVNEFARLSEKSGLDVVEIIEAAKTKWSFQPHYPSVGVGGHCIPVDPWYLVDFGKKRNVDLPLIEQSLKENDDMAHIVAEKVISQHKVGMNVLLYGLTYKKDVDDIRESPVVRVARILQKNKIQFSVYDPLIEEHVISSFGFTLGKLAHSDIFIVGTDHKQIANDYKKCVGKQTVIVDGRNYFRKKVGKLVLGVGRSLR